MKHKTKFNLNTNSKNCHDVIWVHPINVCIEENRISSKIHAGIDNQTGAISKQYLQHGDDGSIKFTIPGIDDNGNSTMDWTQGFFIGFSTLSIDPNYENNIIGVRYQQLPDDTEQENPYRGKFSVFIGDLLMHTVHFGTPVRAGDTITLSIKEYIFSIKFNEKVKEICKRPNKYAFETESPDQQRKPMVAKIAFDLGKHKVVNKVKLFGDWKTDSDCTTAPFHY